MAAESKPSLVKGLILPLLVLTLAAAGGGTLIGMQIVASVRAAHPQKPEEAAKPTSAAVKELAPIVVNLASPDGAIVRLQTAIVYDRATTPEIEGDGGEDQRRPPGLRQDLEHGPDPGRQRPPAPARGPVRASPRALRRAGARGDDRDPGGAMTSRRPSPSPARGRRGPDPFSLLPLPGRRWPDAVGSDEGKLRPAFPSTAPC